MMTYSQHNSVELEGFNPEAVKLAITIKNNFEELGV